MQIGDGLFFSYTQNWPFGPGGRGINAKRGLLFVGLST